MSKFYLEIYTAKDGHRWRVSNSRNKNIVMESGEAYANRANVKRAIRGAPIDRTKLDFVSPDLKG